MKPKFILILSLVLLFGCSYNFDSERTKSNFEGNLTIRTVEFSSNNIVVTNVGVQLIEKDSGKLIGQEMVDEEGIVKFTGLKINTKYQIIIHQILPSGEWHEQKKEEIIYNQDNSLIMIETFNVNKKYSLRVPVVLQNPELPNGCEVTALTAVLNYYGLKIDKLELAKYLPTQPIIKKGNTIYGPDPNVAYAGNPSHKTDAYYVFPIPIVETANQVLIKHNSELRAIDMPNLDKYDFIEFIQQGVPIISWVTVDFREVYTKGYWIIHDTSEKQPLYGNLHVVVVTGYQNGKVFIMNPLKGNEVIDEEKFFNSFQSMGSKAVVIL